jgi:hypothetical protein
VNIKASKVHKITNHALGKYMYLILEYNFSFFHKLIIPATAAGTVLFRVVTVAAAISWGVYLVGHD